MRRAGDLPKAAARLSKPYKDWHREQSAASSVPGSHSGTWQILSASDAYDEDKRGGMDNLGPKIAIGVGIGLFVVGILLVQQPMDGALVGVGFVFITGALLSWKIW